MILLPPALFRRACIAYAIWAISVPVLQYTVFKIYWRSPIAMYYSVPAVLTYFGPPGLIAVTWYYPHLRLSIAATLLAVAVHAIVQIAHSSGPFALGLMWHNSARALGLYVFLAVFGVLVFRSFRRPLVNLPGRCLNCGYLDKGWSSSRCPECGWVRISSGTKTDESASYP